MLGPTLALCGLQNGHSAATLVSYVLIDCQPINTQGRHVQMHTKCCAELQIPWQQKPEQLLHCAVLCCALAHHYSS